MNTKTTQTGVEEIRNQEHKIRNDALEKLHKTARHSNFYGIATEVLVSALRDTAKLYENTISQAKEEERKQIIHEWNKAEQKLDGTTQGALNCIEHYRQYLQALSNNT